MVNSGFDHIESSRYSIHDLSRCQAIEAGEHYRLNMPFELGIDFGCRRYGNKPLSRKVILILEEQRYRYQAAISDLAGSDIKAHGGKHETAVRKVSNWLAGTGGFKVTSKNAILGIFRDGNGKCDFPFPSFSITYVIKNGSISLCCTGTSNF